MFMYSIFPTEILPPEILDYLVTVLEVKPQETPKPYFTRMILSQGRISMLELFLSRLP